MDDEWISEKEAAARITLRTNLQDPEGLLDDAVREGKIRIDRPPMIGVSEAIRGDLNIYAGGFTAIDAEYDERLGWALRTRVSLHDLNAWMDRLLGKDRKAATPAGNNPSQERSKAIYAELYPEGHRGKDSTKEAIFLVQSVYTARHGGTVSESTVRKVFRA